ncbi:hypothetical protein GF325_15070 [Candidatus Bathyarchaeota archaeon]|nr:hypothetical protein [Candidatus Bathyarchaeota archaeon]
MNSDTPAKTLEDFYDWIIVRFTGEIILKSERLQNRLLNTLMKDLHAVLSRKGLEGTIIERTRSRIFLESREFESLQDVKEALSIIPGIRSFSRCKRSPLDLEKLDRMMSFMADRLFTLDCTFAIRVRRVGEHHPFSSQDIERRVGRLLLDKFPEMNISVDLEHPDVTLRAEIRDDEMVLFHEIHQGIGGIPSDSTFKVKCFLDDKERSVENARALLKRGIQLAPCIIFPGESRDIEDLLAELNSKKKFRHMLARALALQPSNNITIKVLPHDSQLEILLSQAGFTTTGFLRDIFIQIGVAYALQEQNNPQPLTYSLAYSYALHGSALPIKVLSAILHFIHSCYQDIPSPILLLPILAHGDVKSNLIDISPFTMEPMGTILKNLKGSRNELVLSLQRMSDDEIHVTFNVFNGLFTRFPPRSHVL